MPLSVASTSVSGRNVVTYTNRVALTDSTAKDLFTLEKGDIPMNLWIYSAAGASNAGVSALLSIGSTGNATYFAQLQVKSGMHSVNGPSTPSTVNNLMEPLAFQTTVTGTLVNYPSATTGGPWTVIMDVLKR